MSRFFMAAVLCAVVAMTHAQQVGFEQYKVPANQCYHFPTTSGSHVFVQEGALVSDNDTVLIHYRELLDPVDMVLHNVQMHIAFGADRFQLESSGMFEIYALDGEDTMTVQQGKRIMVQMGVDKIPPRDSQGYKYNLTSDSWDAYKPIGTQTLVDDDDLWGSSSLADEAVEVWDGDDFGWDGFSAYDSTRREIFQSMEISEFGLFNYDKVLDGVEYQYIQAEFRDEANQTMKSTVYVVYEDINSVFYFPEYNWESKFFLIKDRAFKMFTIDADGAVSLLRNSDDLTPTTSDFTFRMKGVKKEGDTRETLSQLLSP